MTLVVRRGRRSRELGNRKRRGSRRGLKRKLMQGNYSEEDRKSSDEPPAKSGRISTLRKSTDKDFRSDCFRCKESGDTSTLVRRRVVTT